MLDNSSTHVIPEGCTAYAWEADGFKFRGFKMEKTRVDFNLPDTTTEVKALDVGTMALSMHGRRQGAVIY